MTVGIFGIADDPQVQAVAEAAESRGVSTLVLRLDGTEMSTWTWTIDGIARADGTRLDELDAIYVRSIPTPIPRHTRAVVAPDEQSGWMAAAEAGGRMLGAARAAQQSLQDHGVDMVNPVDCFWFHRSKPGADQRLAHHGIPVPRGIVTSDASAVRAFVDEVGEVVYKPVAGGGACRLLDPEDLDEPVVARSIGLAPVLFQERIEGRDLRVYVVGDRVVGGCVIHTDAIDYRGNETRVELVDVTESVADVALRSAAALGMTFTGIDIKQSSDGRLTVLDVNPSPMFVGIGRATGLDVAGALADRLMGLGS